MQVGVLFDLDGTLLDTLQDLADSVNFALQQFGMPVHSLEEVRSFVGNGARNLRKSHRSMLGRPLHRGRYTPDYIAHWQSVRSTVGNQPLS